MVLHVSQSRETRPTIFCGIYWRVSVHGSVQHPEANGEHERSIHFFSAHAMILPSLVLRVQSDWEPLLLP